MMRITWHKSRPASATCALPFLLSPFKHDRRLARSRVAIVAAPKYSAALTEILRDALKLFNLDLRGKSVLLKPNLVDHVEGVEINTHPFVIGAAVECFLRLGAAHVTVAEGPGHQRDTQLLLFETGLAGILKDLGTPFIDLNRDDLVKVRLNANRSGLKELWLPKTAMRADFIVSMPKVKTHHWSGVTLSMKNMFGLVPGVKYGWPKNVLHWRGINRCIVDIVATVPIHFVIADAIVCMEGNGPLAGTPRHLDCLILADDPVAADATCARMMGLRPEAVPHIRAAGRFLGNMDISCIEQLACPLGAPAVPFAVLPEFTHLRTAKRAGRG
jgi:uncharacterized protein (DUF362 family)